MKQESLNIIRDKVMQVVSDSEIDQMDKVELLVNLYHLLDIRNYEEAIMLLQRRKSNEVPIYKGRWRYYHIKI